MTAPAFDLPEALEAAEPPEARGLARDDVRLMVARRSDGRIAHAAFRDLPQLLAPGDLLVVNVSATLPAAVPARRADGSAARVHFSTRAPQLDASWRVVELRSADGTRPARGRAGDRVELRGGAALDLVAPYASGARVGGRRRRQRPGPLRLDRLGDLARARAADRRRSDHRLARAGGLASAAARGGGRSGAAGALLSRGASPRLSVARVRRQPPDPAVIPGLMPASRGRAGPQRAPHRLHRRW
jgi:hypothetical protein